MTQVVDHQDLLVVAQQVAATVAANHRPAVATLLASYRKFEAESAGDGIAVEAASPGLDQERRRPGDRGPSRRGRRGQRRQQMGPGPA